MIDPQLVFDNSFGGGGFTSAAGVVLDAQGNIYVAGQTISGDFPVKGALQNHAGAPPLLASTDGGQMFTAPAVGPAIEVRSIASSAAAPLVLYAVTDSGIVKSTDGGNTWTTPATTGLTAVPTVVAVDAGSASTVYGGSGVQGVFTSTDGGANWTQSTDGLMIPGGIPQSTAQISDLVASPQQAGTVFAVALIPDFVYRSTDFGRTCKRISLPDEGGAPQALIFSPADSRTLYLGQSTKDLLMSTDGGDTWTNLSTQNVVKPRGLAIFPDNPSIFLAASASSLNRSTDGGKTWSQVLALTFGEVAVDPRHAGVAYALDSSGVYRSTDGGQNWTRLSPPANVLPLALFVSPADSRVFVGQGALPDAFVTKWSPDGSRMLYSTYLGGSGTDAATGLAVDATGSVYLTGFTNSPDFPLSANAVQKTLAGTQNAFVAKLSPDGSQLMYSTLLGGGQEEPGRIAVDSAGQAVIVGSTGSTNFPTTAGAFQSKPVAVCSIQSPFVATGGVAFVSKLAADGGSLVFSTLLGGTCGTRAQAVGIDPSGLLWVAGLTDSPDFPVTKDALQSALGGDIYDGFLARFGASGSLDYASYVGGKGYDTVSGIAFDAKGNLYLTGTSGGLPQAASAGALQSQVNNACVIFTIGPSVYQDVGSGFLLKLDPTARNTLGLTYLGSPLCLYPSDIAVDAAGQPWIGGGLSPRGSSPQTAAPFQIGIGNGFASKFSADLSQLLFSTYFDAVAEIALDPAGLAYVAGAGPVQNQAQKAYVAKIDPTPPAISLDAVQNAVDPSSPSNTQGIGPGELLRILGKNLGPSMATPGVVEGGVLASSVAGVQVTFDSVPVPLLSVSAGEIDLIAPFELAGKSATTVQVHYNGGASNAVPVGVANGPRILGVPSGIPLQVLGIFNSDFTANSASNPAAAGSVVTLYVSGAGQTVPPSQDGQINRIPLAAAPSPVQIGALGNPANDPNNLVVTFAGAAPGLAAGIFQVNFVAPENSAMNLTLTVGQAIAPINVFVR